MHVLYGRDVSVLSTLTPSRMTAANASRDVWRLTSMYPLAGVVPPDISRAVARRIKGSRWSEDARHPPDDHPAEPQPMQCLLRCPLLECTRTMKELAKYNERAQACTPSVVPLETWEDAYETHLQLNDTLQKQGVSFAQTPLQSSAKSRSRLWTPRASNLSLQDPGN